MIRNTFISDKRDLKVLLLHQPSLSLFSFKFKSLESHSNIEYLKFTFPREIKYITLEQNIIMLEQKSIRFARNHTYACAKIYCYYAGAKQNITTLTRAKKIYIYMIVEMKHARQEKETRTTNTEPKLIRSVKQNQY
jgi:hypothetical protein